VKIPRFLVPLALLFVAATGAFAQKDSPREKLVNALLAEPSAQPTALRGLIGLEDAAILPTLTAWRQGELFLFTAPDGHRIPFTLSSVPDNQGGFAGLAVIDGQPLLGAGGKPLSFKAADLTPLDTNNALRRAIRDVSELAGVSDPNPGTRASAAERLGQSQKREHLGLLQGRLAVEKSTDVRKALAIAIGMIQLASPKTDEQLAAIDTLVANHSLSAVSQFKTLIEKSAKTPGSVNDKVVAAARNGVVSVETYFQVVNFFGTLFRGLSLSSVLLIMALGLAITFGLMGVINMAHGEVMVVGAYATYLVQNVFISWFGKSGAAFSWYFVVALPVAFFSSAIVGLLLERLVIRFLYRRPLESLLATWGVSLILQQTFRLIFGAANVQILSPEFLMGNFTFHDIIFAYNRVFVIGFAAVVVTGMWILLTRTPLGLMIRAVTQNRAMASCMGVRTDRVNMLTFAFGSGLAGLAGACLTQLGNVGPSLGQTHIVDNFMVVVSGGVGNLFGTVLAAAGIGTIDQVLQPWLGAVMGKIVVLVGIILFLQWKPGGLFPSRSRSLD
jgi:urea transport system permease protein